MPQKPISDRPTKDALGKKWIDTIREKLGNPVDLVARPNEVVSQLVTGHMSLVTVLFE